MPYKETTKHVLVDQRGLVHAREIIRRPRAVRKRTAVPVPCHPISFAADRYSSSRVQCRAATRITRRTIEVEYGGFDGRRERECVGRRRGIDAGSASRTFAGTGTDGRDTTGGAGGAGVRGDERNDDPTHPATALSLPPTALSLHKLLELLVVHAPADIRPGRRWHGLHAEPGHLK